MSETVYLLDHENQAKADLANLADDSSVVLFLGMTSTINRALFRSSMDLGRERVSSISIEGTGKNALDFHLAFHLGEILSQSPRTRCVIVSRDKGFAPLVKYLRGRGFDVRQQDSVSDKASAASTVPNSSGVDDPIFRKIVDSLHKGSKQARPRKRLTLAKHVKSLLNGRCGDTEVLAVVDRLFSEGIVKEHNGVLSYSD
jgi:hypothetical protein